MYSYQSEMFISLHCKFMTSPLSLNSSRIDAVNKELTPLKSCVQRAPWLCGVCLFTKHVYYIYIFTLGTSCKIVAVEKSSQF